MRIFTKLPTIKNKPINFKTVTMVSAPNCTLIKVEAIINNAPISKSSLVDILFQLIKNDK